VAPFLSQGQKERGNSGGGNVTYFYREEKKAIGKVDPVPKRSSIIGGKNTTLSKKTRPCHRQEAKVALLGRKTLTEEKKKRALRIKGGNRTRGKAKKEKLHVWETSRTRKERGNDLPGNISIRNGRKRDAEQPGKPKTREIGSFIRGVKNTNARGRGPNASENPRLWEEEGKSRMGKSWSHPADSTPKSLRRLWEKKSSFPVRGHCRMAPINSTDERERSHFFFGGEGSPLQKGIHQRTLNKKAEGKGGKSSEKICACDGRRKG